MTVCAMAEARQGPGGERLGEALAVGKRPELHHGLPRLCLGTVPSPGKGWCERVTGTTKEEGAAVCFK